MDDKMIDYLCSKCVVAELRIAELTAERDRYKNALQKIDRGSSAYLSSSYLGAYARNELKD